MSPQLNCILIQVKQAHNFTLCFSSSILIVTPFSTRFQGRIILRGFPTKVLYIPHSISWVLDISSLNWINNSLDSIGHRRQIVKIVIMKFAEISCNLLSFRFSSCPQLFTFNMCSSLRPKAQSKAQLSKPISHRLYVSIYYAVVDERLQAFKIIFCFWDQIRINVCGYKTEQRVITITLIL
jgi:hypothetical protein